MDYWKRTVLKAQMGRGLKSRIRKAFISMQILRKVKVKAAWYYKNLKWI